MFLVVRTYGPGAATEGKHSDAPDKLDAALSPPPPPPVLADAVVLLRLQVAERRQGLAKRAARHVDVRLHSALCTLQPPLPLPLG
jgi:hypothetical protein